MIMLVFKRFKKIMAVTVLFVTAFSLVGCEEDTPQYTITFDPGEG